MDRPGDVTRLLVEARRGDAAAFDRVYAMVYDELRRVAHAALRRNRGGQTLQTTALVNEAYLKMVGHADTAWENRAHFFSIAARAMKQILIDLARKRATRKRGGEWVRTTLASHHPDSELKLDELLALDEALAALDERQRQVVEYRFFGGMTDDEVAEVLGVTARTVQRDWIKARAWLYRELYPGDPLS
jgi:RNA polymerase sigma factor (TIGR02999 family)